MPKNIVVFSDGTGQEGGKGTNTNVYKTFNIILDRSPNQVSFYDKGLGTGWRKLTGNAAGRGFSKNVLECYRFIFENYQAGDEIFLFGFSRGAATVRSLSGFIHMFGILPRSRGKLVDEAWKIYKVKNAARREKKAEEFLEQNHTMWATVAFMGVWDTVAALGVPNSRVDRLVDKVFPHGFHDFRISESVRAVAHAVAIDDVRKTFHPVFFDRERTKPGQELDQVWFMGMHTDVGGGYAEKELSDIVLEWMVGKSLKHGLRFYRGRGIEGRCTPNPDGQMHDARDKAWKRAIFPAKQRWWSNEKFGKAVIHESVKLRTHSVENQPGAGYEPWILQHGPEIEPWTHLDDWLENEEIKRGADPDSLTALRGWSVPDGPASEARRRRSGG